MMRFALQVEQPFRGVLSYAAMRRYQQVRLFLKSDPSPCICLITVLLIFRSFNKLLSISSLQSILSLASHPPVHPPWCPTKAYFRYWSTFLELRPFQLILHPSASLLSITTCSTTLQLSTKQTDVTTSNAPI